MEVTLGKRIAAGRKAKGLTQDALAGMLDVSPQAVSKWENDQACPDISLLPKLAKVLGISIDTLLSGEEEAPAVQVLPLEKRKNINQLMLRIVADSTDGDKVRVNLPMALLPVALEMGMELPQFCGSDALKNIDFGQILELVNQGVVGNLIEAESSDGDTVRIFVE